MDVQELVTKFTADVSDYRKQIDSIKKELSSVSKVTDSVKEVTKKALGSSSAEMQKLGKQLQLLTDRQNKNTQSAIESGKKIADFKEKSRLLVAQLNEQRAEMAKCQAEFQKLNAQYDEQKKFIGENGGTIDGVIKKHQKMIDYIHNASAESKELLNEIAALDDMFLKMYKTEEAAYKASQSSELYNSKVKEYEKFLDEIQAEKNKLKAFEINAEDIGLDLNNLKGNLLENLEKQMQQLTKQEREYKEASVRTNAQIKSTNQSIALEESRYDNLKSTLEQNGVSVEELTSRITKLGKVSVAEKIKSKFNGVTAVFKKLNVVVSAPFRAVKNIGTAAAGAFNKVKDGFSKIRGASGTANKALLNTVKSIRRIGIASLGLKICKSIFGELRSVVSNYLSQNEELNSRVETLKNSFANALAPAINVVVGLFEKLMPYAISVADAISNVFASLGVSKSIRATGAAIGDTADATKELSEAQNELYGFDKITKQSDDSSDSKSSSTDVKASQQLSKYLEEIKALWASGDFEGIGSKIANSCNSVIGRLNSLDWEGIQAKINKSVSGIARSLNGFVTDFDWYGAGELVGNGLNTVFSAVDTFLTGFDFKGLGAGLANNLNGLFAKVDFGKIGKTLSDGISGAFDLVTGFLETLDWQQVARDVEDFVKGIDWSRMVSSLFEGIGAAVGGLSALLGTWLADAIDGTKAYFQEKIEACGGDIGEGIKTGISDALKNIGRWVYDNMFMPIITGFKNAFGIASPSKAMKEQGGFIVDGLLNGIGNVWDKVRGKFDAFKAKITDFFTGSNGLQSKLRNLGSSLTDNLGNGLSGLKDKFTSCFKEPLNGVIGLINNMISRVNGYLNISVSSTLASVLNKVGVGVSGGRYQLFSIPNIPLLATGGVIDRPTLAMVGERGKEAVVPLENNTGWIAKMAKMLIEYSNVLGGNSSGDIVIPIQIGDERIMVRVDKKTAQKNDVYTNEKINV